MNWILNFVKDERGVEPVEFAVAGLTVAGGAAASLTTIKEDVQTKGAAIISAVTVDAG
ncbi:MAG: Flp family type IVb pilin [Planctomycetaceae bacterium]|nr:Flp family type IVb pilin [Planctomycetaceae bacterium]